MTEETRPEKLLLSVQEAAEALGVNRSTVYALHADGKIPRPVKLGRRTFWRTEELRAWVAAGCPARTAWESTGFDAGHNGEVE